MTKAVVIGATSGIGYELAKLLSINNYEVGIVGRRTELLIELKNELKGKSFIKAIDVSKTDEAIVKFNELISEMNGIDLLIISAGQGHVNPDLDWRLEEATIDVNVKGFTAIATYGMTYFKKQGYGHLVGISSIAALRGTKDGPAYSASKAFVSNYLEGLRLSVRKTPIVVTDIKPGFVDTDMAKGEGLFWVASKEKAAKQIYNAISKKKKHTYITKRWRIIAWILKLLP